MLETKKRKSNNKLSWLLLAVVVVVVVVYGVTLVVKFINRDKVTTADKNRETVEAEFLPGSMPFDLPYLNLGKPTQNFTSKDKDQVVSVRTMYLSEPAEAIKDAYVEYFNSFGWEITTDYAVDKLAVIAAQKDGAVLSMSLTEDHGQRVLELTHRK